LNATGQQKLQVKMTRSEHIKRSSGILFSDVGSGENAAAASGKGSAVG
jgi:hypothetical protein